MAQGKPNKSADFFISYATSDEAIAREIGSILDGAGYTYVAQFRDFPTGTNFVRQIQHGLAASSRLIALLSPAYESSNHCQAEWSAAFAQDPGSEHGKIIPFKIADVELNLLASQIVNRSLIGLSAGERRAAVLEAVGHWIRADESAATGAGRGLRTEGARSEAPATGPPELAGLKPSNLPGSIGHLFKGREEFLGRLDERFRRNTGTAITATAIHGLGGVGKTRTAIEYGHARAADYAATFFLIGKSESDLKDSLAALSDAAVLDLPEKDVPDLDARVAAVIRWLRTNPGWLVIIDNVDDEPAARAVLAFLDQVSRGEGHVLVTSRVSDWGHMVEPLELDLLSVEAAKELLRESTPRRTRPADEDVALTRLAGEQLGCLSLALVQAAAYIEERRIGFADYVALFDKEARKLLAKLGEAAMRNLSYPLPVALTWQASIAQLSDSGRLLLDMLAWLSIEPIPRSLFAVWPDTELVDLDESLAQLTRYSFVHWEAESSAITVHRLVAQVTRDNLDSAGRDRALSGLFRWLSVVNPDMNASDVRCWPRLLPLLPHVLPLFEQTSDSGPYPGQVKLYNEYATLLQWLARYSEAEPLFRKVLAIEEARQSPDHAGLTWPVNNLALLLRKTRRLEEAETLYRRALAITEANFGPDDPVVAVCLSNLAVVLQNTNRLTEAETLYRRALEIDESSFHPNHPVAVSYLNNLASLLKDTNRHREAETIYGRALELGETTYGPDHPMVGTCLHNLAALFCSTGRFGEAEPLFHRASLIYLRASKASGHLLPNTVPTLRNYAFAAIDAGWGRNKVSVAIARVMTEAGFVPAELWPQVFGENG